MAAFVRFVVCGELAVIAHLILFVLIDGAEPRAVIAIRPPVEIQLVRPPPPPPQPEPEPEIEQPTPTKQVHEQRRAKPRAVRVANVAVDTPTPLDQATVPADTTTTPVFGVTMNSTSGPGGVAVKVGNTADPSPGGSPKGAVKPLAEPAAAVDVTQMPIPRGRCTGKYTEAARAASLEGVVVLDLVVDDIGRSRDITVVTALGHGLTEAAIQALRDCRFTPGQKSGKPVAVRVRGFKIRFLLDD